MNTSIGYAGETPAPLSVKLIKRAKLFSFLREIRHLLFDKAFQEELSTMYAEAVKGHPHDCLFSIFVKSNLAETRALYSP